MRPEPMLPTRTFSLSGKMPIPTSRSLKKPKPSTASCLGHSRYEHRSGKPFTSPPFHSSSFLLSHFGSQTMASPPKVTPLQSSPEQSSPPQRPLGTHTRSPQNSCAAASPATESAPFRSPAAAPLP